MRALDRLGYRGDYSFEVFNDDYQQLPLPVVAERARRAAVWLAEDVLRRSLPARGLPLRSRTSASAAAGLDTTTACAWATPQRPTA